MRVTTYMDGPAPPELAWERYADPDLWSTWAKQIRSVETDQDVPLRIHSGLSGTVHTLVGINVRFTVADVDEGSRSWSWTVNPPPFTMHLMHTVRPRQTGSRAGLVIYGPGPLILAYLPVARSALRGLVAL